VIAYASTSIPGCVIPEPDEADTEAAS
jgi:hypothetical protein